MNILNYYTHYETVCKKAYSNILEQSRKAVVPLQTKINVNCSAALYRMYIFCNNAFAPFVFSINNFNFI